MTFPPVDLTVVDDDGVLAVVDTHAYAGFVDEDWSLEQVRAHLRAHAGHVLAWSMSDGGGDRLVEVRAGWTARQGTRETRGGLTVTAGELHVVTWTALTMAAQFRDEVLPAAHEADAVVVLPVGDYRARVVQLRRTDEGGAADPSGADVLVELEPGVLPGSGEIAWL